MSLTKVYLEEQDELSRIIKRIEGLVTERVGLGPYYLSQLGSDLGTDKALLERLSRKKLADFVENELKLDVRRTGAHNNIFYIAPAGAPPDFVPSARPSFPRGVLLAFTTPIPEGEGRVLDLRTLRFGPPDGDDAERLIRPIDPVFIRPGGNLVDAVESIEKWLAEQDLPASALQKSASNATAISTAPDKSLLSLVLEALDRDQLARVSLPLDVIKVLSERAGRR